MRNRLLVGVFSGVVLACAGSPKGALEPPLPANRAELAAALVEAGIVRSSVAGIVKSFRELAIKQVDSNVRALERQTEEMPPERRTAVRNVLAEMPTRFPGDLDAFLESIDFESLTADLYGPIYEDRFEVEELQAILLFYRSPAGQRFARENAAIESAGSRELAARLEPTLESFMRQWFDDQLRGL